MSGSVSNDVILIGPYGTGKSTIAEIASQRLGWAWYSLDNEYYHHWKQMEGFDLLNQMNRWELTSPQWQPHNIYVIEKFLSGHAGLGKHCVFDFGVGHTIYDNREYLERVKQILALYTVVLLIPSPDIEDALKILLDRVRKHGLKGRDLSDEKINEINRHALQHHSVRELATFVIYTKDKRPEDTFEDIWERINAKKSV